jgi:hypothetical protein
MAFEETPEDVQTGTYKESIVDETETEEVWIRLDVTTEDGTTEERAFGFIIIPPENVSWAKKNSIVQEVAKQSAGPNFDALGYYKSMFEYQVQDTSFLPDHTTVREWLDENANQQLVEEVEEYIPEPVDMGPEGVAEAVLDVMESYAESSEGSWEAPLEHFKSWLESKSGVGGGEQGK